MLVLGNQARIAVIGAGPAGCFFAHTTLQLASRLNRAIQVTLFDGKDFTQSGPVGCNMCAGVLSASLLQHLQAEGIYLPNSRLQREVSGYYLQMCDEGIDIMPPGQQHRITTVYRGNGPRFCEVQGVISFDDFLLEQVKVEGARVIQQPVRAITLPVNRQEPIRLTYGSKGEESTFEADLVVCAFGVNSAMIRLLERLGFGYHPPRLLRLCQAELPLPADYIQQRLKNRIFTFNLELQKIHFAAWVPKANRVSMTVVCTHDATKQDLLVVLNHPAVRQWLPPGWHLPVHICSCYPSVPLTASVQPYTDRLVIIGDACCSRYFKNGIESAYITARLAAQTALNIGVSQEAFRDGYDRILRRTLIRDNRYGRFLFKIDYLISHYDILRRIHLRVAQWPASHPASRQLHEILWNMSTGDCSYHKIFWTCMHPNLLFHLLFSTVQVCWETLRQWFSQWLKR